MGRGLQPPPASVLPESGEADFTVVSFGSSVLELSTSSLLGVQTGSWEGVRAPFKVKVKGDTDLAPVPSDIAPDSSWDNEALSQGGR